MDILLQLFLSTILYLSKRNLNQVFGNNIDFEAYESSIINRTSWTIIDHFNRIDYVQS